MKIHPKPTGFQDKQSTLQSIQNDHDICREEHIARLYIALKSAYDRVDHQILLEKLKKRGLPPIIISTLISLIRDNIVRVVVEGSNSSLTQRIKVLTGVFQGSLLSPLLFSVYIDDLIQKLENGDKPCKNPISAFYADDINLNFKTSTSVKHIKHQISIIDRWCKNNNMIINIKKWGLQVNEMHKKKLKDGIWINNESSNYPNIQILRNRRSMQRN